MATSKTLAPTNVTISIPAMTDQPDASVFSNCVDKEADAINALNSQITDRIKCIRMELGEPDASGRRSPVPVEGSEFTIECDAVIMSLGTSPNPLIKKTTAGLEVNRKGGIVVNESEMTSRAGVFAGGDAVTGAATVILAMGAGKAAAKGIDEYLSKQ